MRDSPELAPFSLAALYGPPVVAKPQGKTGQGVSAAGFLPAMGTQYKKEAAIAQGAHGPSHRLSLAVSAKDKDPPTMPGWPSWGKICWCPVPRQPDLQNGHGKRGRLPDGKEVRPTIGPVWRPSRGPPIPLQQLSDQRQPRGSTWPW
jgi:hypothetical protein